MLRSTFGRISFFRAYNKGGFIRVRTNVLDNILEQQPKQIQWGSVRDTLLKGEIAVNQANVDTIIISKCFNGKHLDVALSYINFLKSNSLKINDATISQLIRLYYRHRMQTDKRLSEEDENEIIKWCQVLCEKDLIESTMADNIIHGLSITREWMKAFKYLEIMKTLDKEPSESTYTCLLAKATQENREDIVWKLLREMTEKNLLPRTYFFIKWFEYHQNDLKKIEDMLQFIGENNALLPEAEIQRVQESLRKIFNVSLVTINRTGKCPSCTQKLPGVKLLPVEFSKMATTLLNDILIRDDVFLKSNPEEVKRFKEFVDKTAPYDSVVDGLNVSYSQGDRLPPAVYAKILCQVVNYFVNNGQKCLVIGRKHMKSWPRKEMAYIRENAFLFLAEDLSHDDLFLLYAALKSGPKTNIFSRDLFRQHSHLLSNRMKQVFRRWQQEHQFQLITTKANNRIIVREPILFELRAHKVGQMWHLPFTNENQRSSIQTFNLPTSWLCLKERLPSVQM